MTSLFTIPIPSTGGQIVCSNPSTSEKEKNIYLLTFASGKDNRLTPGFIDALLLALDVIEHRFPKGVVITTSGIAKFYSNGLDLELALATEGFMPNWLWKLFRRFLTYPMPTISLLNGHAFAGGFMLAMYHDYRIQNPTRGFLCVNELDFGVPLQAPMMTIFREKLVPASFRDVVLGAKRWTGPESHRAGIVDEVGGLEEALKLIRERGLLNKAETGIYGTMKEEMYRGSLGLLDDHEGNLAWRERVEEKKDGIREDGIRAVPGAAAAAAPPDAGVYEAGTPTVTKPPTPAPAAAESSGDESEMSDGDEGDVPEEELDEEQIEQQRQFQQRREEVAELEGLVRVETEKWEHMQNQILKNKLARRIQGLKQDLSLKKVAIGEGDELDG